MKQSHAVTAFLASFALMILSSPISGMTAEKDAPRAVVLEIVDAMVKDGKIEASCVKEQTDKADIVNVTLVRLTEGDQNQFLVEGNMPCAFGARTAMYWVYARIDGKYRMLADIGASDKVQVSKNMTKGWRDIFSYYTYAAGTKRGKSILRFNGTKYVQ